MVKELGKGDGANEGKAQAVLREIATIMSDPAYPAFDGLLRANDDTLATRGGAKGLKIYRELERDPRVHSVIQKRQTAVVEREWYVEPAAARRREKKAAEVCETALNAMNFDKLCVDLLDALLMGFSSVELMWRHDAGEGLWLIDETLARDQARFVFTDEREPRLLTRREMIHGERIPARKIVFHSFGGKDGNPNGVGLGSKLFWPVYFKRQGIQFWLVLADRYGNPTTLGKYPRNADDLEIRKVLNAMQALSHDGSMAMPDDWIIELLESKAAGNVTTHEQLCRYMDEQIAECVLGETLTTNVGKVGSKAAAETHNDVREILVKFDADMLSQTLNRTLMRWITEVNLGFDVSPPKVWRRFEEDEDVNERVKRDETLHRMGWVMTPEKFEEVYGEGYVYKKPARPTPPSGALDVARQVGDDEEPGADQEGQFAEEHDRDAVDDLADQLAAIANPASDTLIDRIKEELGAADSLEAFQARLPMLFVEMGEEELADVLRRGFVTAELFGRAEIEDGDGAPDGGALEGT